ncbi:ABC transporter permease [Anaerovorax odorimutans]|uniref:ABC transporter permease n=1 Tax=Anaerovorax odorimutans TaxID=109327 RepID=UPI0004243E59|nr:ABC transporter permease [Anaerovorax odorimutans]
MKSKIIAIRILTQLKHDKRTLMLVLAAPLLMLTLVYLILDTSDTDFTVGIINAPQNYVENLYKNNIKTIRYNENSSQKALENGDIIATVNMISGKLNINIDGSNSQKSNAVLTILEASKLNQTQNRPDLKTEVNYVYGSSDLAMFDNFGGALIGILVFFFVFLISGISFLKERTTGTLEKLLSTPIKRFEIVCGYAIGFGILTIFQSLLITLFVVYILDVMMVGSIWLVLLITLLSAMTALTLGILISTAAASEFQMVQFIPIIIVPQIFFSGLFDLSPTWSFIGKFMPLYYVADALNQVMINGNGFSYITLDILILIGFSSVFIIMNTLLLKKYRRI